MIIAPAAFEQQKSSKMSLYRILQLIMAITFYITLVMAIYLTKRSANIPKEMRSFYYYPIVGVFVITILLLKTYFKLIPPNISHLIDNYSLLFHFGFLSLFLFQKIKKTGILKYFKIIVALYLLAILTFLMIFDSTLFNGYAYGLTNIGLLSVCIIYFANLLENRLQSVPSREPFFWVANGIFFGCALSTPINFTSIFFYHNLPRSTYLSIVVLAPLAYLVMYLFFIKAYLCLIIRDSETSKK